MDKRTPTQKSIIRHKLKQIDKKYSGMKVAMPSRAKALDKMRH